MNALTSASVSVSRIIISTPAQGIGTFGHWDFLPEFFVLNIWDNSGKSFKRTNKLVFLCVDMVNTCFGNCRDYNEVCLCASANWPLPRILCCSMFGVREKRWNVILPRCHFLYLIFGERVSLRVWSALVSDVNQVRRHIEFHPDKIKAVRDRLPGVSVHWKFWFGMVIKLQCNPLNSRFHSCQRWNLALPWLKSIEKLVSVFLNDEVHFTRVSFLSSCTEEGLLFWNKKRLGLLTLWWRVICLFLSLSEPVSTLTTEGMKAKGSNYKIKEL